MRDALTELASAVVPLAVPLEVEHGFAFGSILVTGAAGAPWSEFWRARRRITASLTGRALFAALEASTEPTTVALNRVGIDAVDHTTGEIRWDPRKPAGGEDVARTQERALCLALLLGAMQSAREAPHASAAAMRTADPAFGDAWTRHLIERWEAPLLRDLGTSVPVGRAFVRT